LDEKKRYIPFTLSPPAVIKLLDGQWILNYIKLNWVIQKTGFELWTEEEVSLSHFSCHSHHLYFFLSLTLIYRLEASCSRQCVKNELTFCEASIALILTQTLDMLAYRNDGLT